LPLFHSLAEDYLPKELAPSETRFEPRLFHYTGRNKKARLVTGNTLYRRVTVIAP
jgi:hypothetical protein